METGWEIVVQDANPWDVLALREALSLASAFNHAQFADALAIAQTLAENMDGVSKKFYGVIDMINGYTLWDTFNHKKALTHLSRAEHRLAPFAVGNPRIGELFRILKHDVERVERLQQDATALQSKAVVQGKEPGRPYLLDLLRNAQGCVDDPLGNAFLAQETALNGALQSRDTSLLAHGYVPIGKDKYEKLMTTALEFLKADAASLSAFPWIDRKALLL